MKKSRVLSLAIAAVAAALFCEDDTIAFLANVDVLVPPNYFTFVPPAARGSFVDPVFGSIITRISDAANTNRADALGRLPWVQAEFSTKSPFNADNSKILLLEFSYFSLYDGVTLQRIKPYCCNGEIVFASSEPLWSRTDPNLFYFHSVDSNQLKAYNTATDVVNIVRTFAEYGSISARGESEVSYDGDHMVIAGDGNEVFVYTISADRKGSVLETYGHNPLGWDAIYITPDNNVLIAWLTNGSGRFEGEELYDENMNFLRQVADNNGHKHLTRDVDGREILVQSNFADAAPLANCVNGIVKIDLGTAGETCLLKLNFSLTAHITAPDQAGWIFVETYNGTNAMDPWFTYTNELLQIKLDGTEVRRLAHHRSDSSTYDGQPRVSVSRDGSRFVFNSNMMGSTTDVYIAPVGAALSSISPTSGSEKAFVLTVTGSNFWSGSKVQWNGVSRPTTFVSSTQLTAAISNADLSVGGPALVTVFNPVFGGQSSNAMQFTVIKKRRGQALSL